MGDNVQLLKRILADRLLCFCLICVFLLVFIALIADYLPLYNPEELVSSPLLSPNRENIFGTDRIGRDLFSRVIYGSRYSLFVGFVTVLIGLVFGVPLGIIAGYSELLRSILMRCADFLWAFPSILLAIVLAATFGPGIRVVIIALAVSQIPSNARLIFGQTLVIKELSYVKAAEASGANIYRILFKHILPNVITPVLVALPLRLGTVIISETSLSFLGVGIQPPTPSWGLILREGFKIIYRSSWSSIFPGLAIFFLVLLLIIIGDRLNNILDPKRRLVNKKALI